MPYQSFATADGDIILAVGNDGQFQRFCKVAGCDNLAEDPRYATNANRVSNRDEIVALLKPIIAAKPSEFWLTELEKNNVSCGPINRLDQVFADPQFLARGMRLDMPHPKTGTKPVSMVASPLKFSKSQVDYRLSPPVLGQHSEEVLGEVLGLSADEVAGLRDRGVI